MTLPGRVRFNGLVSLLVGALFLVQMLGLAHKLVHGPERQFLHGNELSTAVTASTHGEQSETSENASWLAGLFSGHADDADCRLFDQASHGSAAPSVAGQCLPTVLALQVFRLSRGEALAQTAAPYSARAPPLTR